MILLILDSNITNISAIFVILYLRHSHVRGFLEFPPHEEYSTHYNIVDFHKTSFEVLLRGEIHVSLPITHVCVTGNLFDGEKLCGKQSISL